MIEEVKRKILVVDDEKLNRQLIADLLSDSYKIIMANNGEQALDRARKHIPDLILLDIMMPDTSGYDVIKQLKSQAKTKHISVIFITALTTEVEEERGFALGAVDYITKPFRPNIVTARVKIHMELVNQQKRLEELTNLDSLTGIYNRRKFDEMLLQEWHRCMRSNKQITLAMVDIDSFKHYNDNYGHGAGDITLQIVAKTLSDTVKRSADFCARYGGEEFAMILPEITNEGSEIILEACRNTIEGLAIPHAYSQTSDVISISIGAVCVIPVNGLSCETFLKQADEQLYEAKRAGRNQIKLLFK
jgi:diguanylate cyclase (GGDEF)-like protein